VVTTLTLDQNIHQQQMIHAQLQAAQAKFTTAQTTQTKVQAQIASLQTQLTTLQTQLAQAAAVAALAVPQESADKSAAPEGWTS
jgi:hypothetical protein